MPRGFKQSNSDHALMTKKNEKGDFIALLIYMDDVLLASINPELIKSTKDYLNEELKIKDFEEAKYFLVLELARSLKGINLPQRKYILDLLKDMGFMYSKPTSTTMATNLN